MWHPETLPTVYTSATTIRPKAIEMKPRSAPENGAFVPPSSSRIAGTEPAPMTTSNAVPIASAKSRWAAEKDSISDLLPAQSQSGREPIPRFPRASSPGNGIRHCRTPFGERTTSYEELSRPAAAFNADGRAAHRPQNGDGAMPFDVTGSSSLWSMARDDWRLRIELGNDGAGGLLG